MKKHIGILLLLLFVVAALTVSGCKAPPDTEPPEDQETPGGDLPGKPSEGDDPMQSQEKLNIYKSVSHRTAETVSPGETLTYTVTVKNSGTKAAGVEIKDTLPAKTAYVSGNGTVSGRSVTLTANVPAGGEAALTYTVRVNADASGTIVAPKATAGKLESESLVNYVGLTFNAIDRAYMAKGITAMAYCENADPVSLAKYTYTVAFTKAPDLTGTPEELVALLFEEKRTDAGDALRGMVAPTLYGKKGGVTADRFRGAGAAVARADLIAGDLLLQKSGETATLLIYNGTELIALNGKGTVQNTEAVLSALGSADAYAVLRPSLSFTSAFANYVVPGNAPLSEMQKALLATAEAYFYRGYRLQYDDTRMPGSYESTSDRGEFRWQIGHYRPEDYTAERWGYTNCAGFTYDLYRTALGYDLGGLYTTAKLASFYADGGKAGTAMYPYTYQPNANATTAERSRVEEEFFAGLQVGDLVVVRRNNGNGHVMMYIGNHTVVHSGGSSFNYTKDQEVYEATIRYMNLSWYLFDKDSANYIFRTDGYIQRLCVVRPLDKFNSSVPAETKNRMESLEGIVAEKLSGLGAGATVNVGDAITFTFRLRNVGDTAKTVAIRESLPAGTTLKTAPGATVDGKTLAWSVTVAPGATVEVSYTVLVSAGADVIHSTDTTVGGVCHTCPPIQVRKTLTEAEQAALVAAVEALRKSNPKGLTGTALLNEIYRQAGLEAPFVNASGKEIDSATLRNALFTSNSKKTVWWLRANGDFSDMLVPTLYGGRKYFTSQQYTANAKPNTDRSRLPRRHDLVVGDVVVLRFLSSEAMYLYVGGDKLVNLGKKTLDADAYTLDVRLMRLMSAGYYYTVLRPSMGME